MIYGNDISHHQTEKAVREIAAGGKSDFIIVRATIGSYTLDKKLDIFERDIKNSGLKNSYYCASYSASREDAVAEAEFLVKTLEKYENKPELAVFFDWEYFSANYIKEQFGIDTTPQLVQGVTEAFCERIKALGYTAGVYLNKDYWDRFYTDAFFRMHPDYKIWYARPGYSKPDKPCDIWQYGSDNGADFGYTGGDLDKNILMGDYLVEVEPMKPLSDQQIRMKIGYASAGDIKKLVMKIEGLGIACETADGYIITGPVSRGDQCYIMVDCNALGVPYEIYTEPQPPQECESCKELKAEMAQMEKNHEAALIGCFETIDGYVRDIHLLEGQKIQLEEKLTVAQNTAEIARNQMMEDSAYIQRLKIENGVLKETIVSLQEKAEETQLPKENLLVRIFEKFVNWLKGV